ncbi:MAG: DNA repair protein RecO [Candidatus Krumholzibacteriia bacterium]
MSLLPQPVAATDAIVLRAWPTGETSVVAALLTARCGQLRVIAKGARGAGSALRPLVQPGRLVSVECGLDPRRQLQYLRAGGVLLDPLAGGNSLERTAFLLAGLELVEQCRLAGDREAGLFELGREFLTMLSCAPREGAARLFYAFELALLQLHGLAPVLEGCAACDSSLPRAAGAAVRFSPAAGGVICGACAAAGRGRDGRPLAWETLVGLRELAAGPAAAVACAAPAWRERETGIVLHGFLGYHLPGYRLPAALALLRAGRPAAAGAAVVAREEA